MSWALLLWASAADKLALPLLPLNLSKSQVSKLHGNTTSQKSPSHYLPPSLCQKLTFHPLGQSRCRRRPHRPDRRRAPNTGQQRPRLRSPPRLDSTPICRQDPRLGPTPPRDAKPPRRVSRDTRDLAPGVRPRARGTAYVDAGR